MPIWDPSFKYIPASNTDVAKTWRRFGFRPTTEDDRRERLRAFTPSSPRAPMSSPGDTRATRQRSFGIDP